MNLLLVLLASVELLGPGSRQATRNQITDRADGTGQFIELALFPSTAGLSRVQLWTSKRVAGKYTRIQLQEKELQIPDPSRIAKELYDFPFPNFSSLNYATAENRVAILCGTTDFTIRTLNTQSLSVGPSIVLPAAARLIGWRPNAPEIWVAHAGSTNQLSISDPVAGRVTGNVAFKLSPQAIPVALLFSNSGRTAFAVLRNPDSTTDRSVLFTIDTATRQIRAQVSLGSTVAQSAAISPDGTTIYISGTTPNALNTPEPSLTAFDALSNAYSTAATGLSLIPDNIVAHPNGLKLYWLSPSNFTIEEFDTQQRVVTRRFSLPRPIQAISLDITPSGDILIVRDGGNQLATHLDSETGEILDTQPIPAGPGISLLRLN